MIVLNFSHPLTPDHVAQIESLSGQVVERVVSLPVQFDVDRPFGAQVVDLVDSVGLTHEEWLTQSFLVNPPSLNLIAVTLLAELHGRMGYLPSHLRLRIAADRALPRFEAAEVLDLQTVRDGARARRLQPSGNDSQAR